VRAAVAAPRLPGNRPTICLSDCLRIGSGSFSSFSQLPETAKACGSARRLLALSKFFIPARHEFPFQASHVCAVGTAQHAPLDFIHIICPQQSHASEHRKLASSKKATNLLRASTMRDDSALNDEEK
jgi:hypothetical protein